VNGPTLLDEVRSLGAELGLDALGVCAAEVFEGTRRDLHERKAAGLSADMAFTYRNPDRSTDPTRILPGARSIVVAARSYLRDGPPRPDDRPHGAVARYVWEDHYGELRTALGAIGALLAEHGHRSRVVVDDNALVDREAAHRAGIGWYGKNANLLLPRKGSWFVLGSLITDAVLPADDPLPDGCGPCERCLTSCPTDAIVAPGVIDARRCLAWLVQARGIFPAEHRVALGDRIYGCDDCQEVCPPNRVQARRPVAVTVAARRPWAPLLEMLEADDETLLDRYGLWYIAERDPDHLRRNALIALANTADAADAAVHDAVRRHVAHERPMLVAHAVWAAHRLGYVDLVDAVRTGTSPTGADMRAGEMAVAPEVAGHPDVVAELARIDAGQVPAR
jgi:epoxyqueuosine reductase